MNRSCAIREATISRRGFLDGAAGPDFRSEHSGRPDRAAGRGTGRRRRWPASIGAWVTISPDGAIVIAIPVAEMGQGSLTGLAMVFAEEMDADWSRVSIVYPPVIPSIFGNPMFGGMMVTYGSGSIRGYWDKIRLQAAAVRNVLMQAAADRWQVPLGEAAHRAEHSWSMPRATARMSYGEIASFAKVPATMPTIDKSALKKTRRLPHPRQNDAAPRHSGKDQRLRAVRHRRASARTWSTPPCCARRSRRQRRSTSMTPRRLPCRACSKSCR